MNLYYYIYVISFISVYFRTISSINNPDLKIVRTGLDSVTPCSVGLRFFVDVNNTSENQDYDVEMSPDECYLEMGHNTYNDILEIIGGCVETIPQGETKRMCLVAPLLDPFERRGYCIVYLDSKSTDIKRSVMRDHVKIPFDTRLKNKNQPMQIPPNVKLCNKVDEDPLNDCKPVDCEMFYNGKKSYYNRHYKRCVEIPPCIAEAQLEMPNTIYDTVKNRCEDEEFVSNGDIEYIKSLLHGNERRAKDIVIIQRIRKPNFDTNENVSKALVNEKKHKDKLQELHGKVQTLKEKTSASAKEKMISMKDVLIEYLPANRYTLGVLGVVVLVQCMLMCAMIYFLSNKCFCKKKVINRYFNYRQDVSVTTPLIGTSNMETDTTDYQYLTDSTDVEKKIKCYKACHKDKNNTAKVSMSDDILSKCLNRREWTTKSAKSEAAPTTHADILKEKIIGIKTTPKTTLCETQYSVTTKKSNETKVNFDTEKGSKSSAEKKKSKLVKSIVKKIESKCSKFKKSERKELKDSIIGLSEKELKCHSYNYIDDSNVTNMKLSESEGKIKSSKPSSHNQKFTVELCRTDEESKKDSRSLSTEKGAQASFSNDSIDDFLSERGMMFLPGENISKYSFSSDSNDIKSYNTSEISSKTSKNNIVRNMMLLLHRRSKHGPLSDPGVKKSKESIDLELLHMSGASLYSSTNNDSECLKSFKRIKESRTSL